MFCVNDTFVYIYLREIAKSIISSEFNYLMKILLKNKYKRII